MKSIDVGYAKGFRVLIGDGRSQAASMVIQAGGKEGGPDNRHSGADQWLYVESGTGVAIVNGEMVELGAGSLVLIERGEHHEIRNTGKDPLRTLNFYVPRAYDDDGDELPAGRR
jgi:mannose-6-phosphate isomerase-like protein (cupin superfamily)